MIFVTTERKSTKSTCGNTSSTGTFIENKGARIHYDVCGDSSPDAAILILLHGCGEDSHVFDAHLSSYAPYYRVITMDSRGCGMSTRGDGELTFDLLADDLFCLLNTLHIGKAVILGFSDGANTAIRFSVAHQERVAALILVGASLSPTGVNASLRFAARTTAKFSALGAAFSKRARSINEDANLMTHEPCIDPADLKRVRVPTLVIAGDRDVIKREHTELIAKSLPDARLQIIPDAGHNVMRDNPRAFDKTTIDFLLEDD